MSGWRKSTKEMLWLREAAHLPVIWRRRYWTSSRVPASLREPKLLTPPCLVAPSASCSTMGRTWLMRCEHLAPSCRACRPLFRKLHASELEKPDDVTALTPDRRCAKGASRNAPRCGSAWSRLLGSVPGRSSVAGGVPVE
jgi:hypothetical protein